MPDRHVAADGFVAHAEVGQVGPHRRARSTLPCSTSRIIAVAANVFEIDAIGKTVCAVTGSGSSTFVTPSPRIVDDAVRRRCRARRRERGTPSSSLRQRGERVEARIGGRSARHAAPRPAPTCLLAEAPKVGRRTPRTATTARIGLIGGADYIPAARARTFFAGRCGSRSRSRQVLHGARSLQASVDARIQI